MLKLFNFLSVPKLLWANSLFFLLLASVNFFAFPNSREWLLWTPAIYFVGSMLCFVVMIYRGLILMPLTWFMLGSGLFFGFGAVAGGLRVHYFSEHVFPESINFIAQVNFLNAGTVFLIMATLLPLTFKTFSINPEDSKNSQRKNEKIFLLWIFPFLLGLCMAGFLFRIYFFPIAENLIVRSLLAKLYFLTPTCFLLAGYLYSHLSGKVKILFWLWLVLEFFLGLMMFTKMYIFMIIIASMLGALAASVKIKTICIWLTAATVIYFVLNPIITLGRTHYDYDPIRNDVVDRIVIIQEVFHSMVDSRVPFKLKVEQDGGYFVPKMAQVEGFFSFIERIRGIAIRFDVATVQGYLMREYQSGRPGESLNDFWALFVPRIFWAQKPNVTRYGPELHIKFYQVNEQSAGLQNSALAPSFNAEAYWNYGMLGVVGISLVMGLLFSFLTIEWFKSVQGVNSAYYFIAFHAVTWTANVESWIVGTYIGEFIVMMVMYLGFKILFYFIKKLGIAVGKNNKTFISPA